VSASCELSHWCLIFVLWLIVHIFFFVAVPTFCYNIRMFDTEIWLFLPCDAMLVRYMPGPVSVTSQCSTTTVLNAGGVG